MSERKVINKYFPADFDPSKIPRRKMGKDRQETVRLMAPFSLVPPVPSFLVGGTDECCVVE